MATTTTTTTETITVVRPVKLIALICASIAFFLLLTAVASDYWLTASDGSGTEYYRQGLWRECYDQGRAGDFNCGKIGEISSSMNTAYVKATAAFMILTMFADLAGIIFIIIGLLNKDPDTKRLVYRIAAVAVFVALLFGVIALSVFAAEFMQEINERSEEIDNREWLFHWSYGIGWGSLVFCLAAGILLLCDKEEEEDVYYSEKTYSSPPTM